jgi:hypothetical protein
MKELIILVYKISTKNRTKENWKYEVQTLQHYGLSNDEELKENYIIREIILPVEGDSDIQVIYPNNKHTSLEYYLSEIEDKIGDNEELKSYWNKILRQIKLRKLNE